ncbi:phosphate butyryltransferase [Oceanirhabdus seepicola]|uniref:Phosphate butyryltransferase n=1 Tax=Oceanirhabdus seepicola TaxID=2828781 RepID=A0A9J6P6V1_9CLOT|nr:phosphate butyryltransferase [Oceanirhabdus seepicola]MCM1992479.1 phosphate butyryltransferase [Oceanirhabdus seepicola]
MIKSLDALLEKAKAGKKITLAVAAAEDKPVLQAVCEAVKEGIVDAILVGDEKEICEIAKNEKLDIKDMRIIHADNVKEAARLAVKCVKDGEAQFLMKGLLGTSVLLKAVLNKEEGLRGGGLLSHVMVYESSAYHKLLLLTDGGMVTYPELSDKVGLINNAVKVAKALEVETPKVAPLCAVEVVNPSMPATLDAAALVQMNRRGQIKGCIIDGPLAFDNAISKEAAEHKGIVSDVAGDADILLVPNIEAGNLLGKSLTYMGGAVSAGVVMGAKCPIVLVSRADSAKSKLYSIALSAMISK